MNPMSPYKLFKWYFVFSENNIQLYSELQSYQKSNKELKNVIATLQHQYADTMKLLELEKRNVSFYKNCFIEWVLK